MAAFSYPAAAQQQCGPRDALVDALKERYGEVRVVSALTTTNQVFEIYASPSGSWSGVLVNPNGIACMAVAGENFDFITPAKPMSAPL